MIKSYDGLRFIFAISIILNHMNYLKLTAEGNFVFENFFHNGRFAVNFFLILSGFCMTLGYGKKFKEISLKKTFEFVKKRLIKIYPIYIFTMFVVFLINIISQGGIFKNVGYLALSSTMLQSVFFKHYHSLNSAGWFISCIFVLYVVTPLIFHIFNRFVNDIKVLIRIEFLLFLGMILLNVLMNVMVSQEIISSATSESFLYVFPLSRIFPYLIGITTAFIFSLISKNNTIEKSTWSILEICSVISVISIYFVGILNKDKISGGISDIIYILFLLFFILIFAFDSGIISSFLSKKIFSYLGGISMEMYLIHYVVINFGGSDILLKLFGSSNISLFIVSVLIIVITILLSILYSEILKKLQRSKKNENNSNRSYEAK